MSLDEFIELFFQIPEDYSVGVHGVTKSDNMIDTADCIMDKGLAIHGWGGLLSNVKMYGQMKDLNDFWFGKIVNYFYGQTDCNEIFTNILFAFPETFTDSNGKEYFLGHFNRNTGYAKGDDEAGDSLPINMMTESTNTVPREFIFGYTINRLNSDDFRFVLNPNFIGFKSNEFKTEFFESIKDKLIDAGLLDKDNYFEVISKLQSFGLDIEEYHKQMIKYYEEKGIGQK